MVENHPSHSRKIQSCLQKHNNTPKCFLLKLQRSTWILVNHLIVLNFCWIVVNIMVLEVLLYYMFSAVCSVNHWDYSLEIAKSLINLRKRPCAALTRLWYSIIDNHTNILVKLVETWFDPLSTKSCGFRSLSG